MGLRCRGCERMIGPKTGLLHLPNALVNPYGAFDIGDDEHALAEPSYASHEYGSPSGDYLSTGAL